MAWTSTQAGSSTGQHHHPWLNHPILQCEITKSPLPFPPPSPLPLIHGTLVQGIVLEQTRQSFTVSRDQNPSCDLQRPPALTCIPNEQQTKACALQREACTSHQAASANMCRGQSLGSEYRPVKGNHSHLRPCHRTHTCTPALARKFAAAHPASSAFSAHKSSSHAHVRISGRHSLEGVNQLLTRASCCGSVLVGISLPHPDHCRTIHARRCVGFAGTFRLLKLHCSCPAAFRILLTGPCMVYVCERNTPTPTQLQLLNSGATATH